MIFESNNLLTLTSSIKIIPVLAMFEVWTSSGLIVKTLPHPLPIGADGCSDPASYWGVCSWSLPLGPLICIDG